MDRKGDQYINYSRFVCSYYTQTRVTSHLPDGAGLLLSQHREAT